MKNGVESDASGSKQSKTNKQPKENTNTQPDNADTKQKQSDYRSILRRVDKTRLNPLHRTQSQ